jgi:uncharacterized protein (UPF0335 family)
LDKIQADISEIKVLDAVQNEQLRDHMRRSDLLEKRVEQVNDELKPVLEHVTMVKGVFKFLGGVGFLAGLLEALRRLW